MVAKGPTAYNKQRYRRRRRRRRGRDEDDEEGESSPKNKWGFPFCFLFTNQAGTVIMSFSGFALIITTMLVHWYAPCLTSTGVRAVQNLLVHAYLFVMLAGFILAFTAAYIEKGCLAKVAALLVFIGTIFYMIFFVMSFLTASMAMMYVCPEMRCPDHHWLQDAMWRGYVIYSENIQRYRDLDKEIKEIVDKLNSALHEEELVSNEFNNSYRFGFLQELFPKSYPERKKPDHVLIKLGNATDIRTQNYATDEPKGHYIRVMSTAGETGNSVLILVSILFGFVIIAFFAYAIVTFYAYGMYLSKEEELNQMAVGNN